MVTIDDVMNYVLHTPENINPSILKQMLVELTGGSEEIIYDGGGVED